MAEVLGRLGKEKGAIRAPIAGSTDTGLNTSLLNAAAAAGGGSLCAQPSPVTLVDQCETPPRYCRRYARANGLQLETVLSDSRRCTEPETPST